MLITGHKVDADEQLLVIQLARLKITAQQLIHIIEGQWQLVTDKEVSLKVYF